MKKRVFVIIGIIVVGALSAIIFLSKKETKNLSYMEKDYQALKKQGDFYFSKMHLFGWRKAEEYYSRAYTINKSLETRDRLFLTLCLIAIREKSEKILNPFTYKKLDALKDFHKNRKQQLLFDLVQRYRSAGVFRKSRMPQRARNKEYVDLSLFDIEKSPLDLYLYLYLLKYYTFEPTDYDERYSRLLAENGILQLIRKYSHTPLFIYFDFQRAGESGDTTEKKFPLFAEFLLHRGDQYFKRRKYIHAFKFYRKALETIPDYPDAINGIANIYYFTVQHFEEAIELYQKTLDLDPLNPVALFGKAVSLHNLGRTRASIRILDFMLKEQGMHHGEAYYFKAYNYFHMKLFNQARKMVKKARVLIPQSGEVNALSGQLYYREKKIPEAELDFLRALNDEELSPCYPLYYLGRINLQAGNWLFFDYFEESCDCFRKNQQRMLEEIEKIDSLDINASLKNWMRKDRKLKYGDYKKMSYTKIWQMEIALEKNRKNKPGFQLQQEQYKKLVETEGNSPLHFAVIKDNVEEMQKLLIEGAPIDTRNKQGYTPLYYAAMLGRTEAVRYLIQKGADLNAQSRSGFTPLHEAAFNNRKEIVKLLIDNGADLYIKDEMDKSPLKVAIENRREEIIPMLTPLHRAVIAGDAPTVYRLLTENPKLINLRDEKGRTPLYLAVVKGDKKLAQQLIDRGGDVNIPDSGGLSPLYRATLKGDTKLRELLVSHKAVLTNADMLKQSLGKKEALIWYVARRGWVIKTANHLLLFDFMPPRRFNIFRADVPFISVGEINPLLLKERKVVSFLSHIPFGHPRLAFVFEWGRMIKDITYVLGWPDQKDIDYHYIAPGETGNVDGMEIRTVKTGRKDEESVGFLVKVDGLVIFHAGNDTCTKEENVGKFLETIRSMGSDWSSIDIAFLPVHGKGGHYQNRDTLLFIKEFQPRMVFPLYWGGKDHYYREFSVEAEKEKLETVINYVERSGERFFLR